MDTPVFIVGCDRSGTTLLSLILSQSPDLHVTLESGFIPDLYKKRSDYGDFSTAKNRWYFIRDLQTTWATSKTIAFDIFGLNDEQAEDALKKAAPTDYAGAIDALFNRTAEIQDKNCWGNKTPKYVLHIPLLHQLFPTAKIIHIVRDPRDVSASIVKAGWTSTIKEAAIYWNEHVSAGLEGRNLKDGLYYEFKYETLLQHPEEETERICKWLGIGFQDDILHSYRDDDNRSSIVKHDHLFDLIGEPIDPSRAYAWKKSMSRADIAEIEDVNRDLIKEFNYQLTGTKIPLQRKLYRGIYDTMVSAGQKLGRNIAKKL
ncbi:sulfotransferase family protein [Rhodohalobacter sp. 8-1]|uniref:sulfotransferase family protein n=1 Tax=Rhodohalobacter sp. 8-1 TaxID=3131972 RepID=UPI0030EF3690